MLPTILRASDTITRAPLLAVAFLFIKAVKVRRLADVRIVTVISRPASIIEAGQLPNHPIDVVVYRSPTARLLRQSGKAWLLVCFWEAMQGKPMANPKGPKLSRYRRRPASTEGSRATPRHDPEAYASDQAEASEGLDRGAQGQDEALRLERLGHGDRDRCCVASARRRDLRIPRHDHANGDKPDADNEYQRGYDHSADHLISLFGTSTYMPAEEKEAQAIGIT